jgi:hypothetical protein
LSVSSISSSQDSWPFTAGSLLLLQLLFGASAVATAAAAVAATDVAPAAVVAAGELPLLDLTSMRVCLCCLTLLVLLLPVVRRLLLLLLVFCSCVSLCDPCRDAQQRSCLLDACLMLLLTCCCPHLLLPNRKDRMAVFKLLMYRWSKLEFNCG